MGTYPVPVPVAGGARVQAQRGPADHRWTEEVNIGDHVFPEHRGRGYATRAVGLMLVHLREDTEHRAATLLIHPDNVASLAVAARNGFERVADVEGRTF